MATFVVAVNHLVEVFDFSHLVNFLSFESIKPFIAMWGQFTHHLTKFLSKWWKPTLFDSGDYRGKSKKVETIKFGMIINSRTGSSYFNETPVFPSQSSLPDNDSTEEKWAVGHEVKPYQRDNRLRSSNLQCLPRNSNDSSFYSDSYKSYDTTHSTIRTRPDYSEENLRDYQDWMRKIESRANRQINRQHTICSRPSQANRFSMDTGDVALKFTDKISNIFKSSFAEKKMDIKIEKEGAKLRRDLSRFFSLNGKSTVEGGGWKKGGRSVVRYYESKKYR